MDRHEVHRIARVDDGVRLVPRCQPLEMFRQPRHRGVAAVLHTADHRANLFQVFARLPLARPPSLERVRRFIEHELEYFGWWYPIDELQPSRNAQPHALEYKAIIAIERRQIDAGAGECSGKVRCQRLERWIGKPDEARP